MVLKWLLCYKYSEMKVNQSIVWTLASYLAIVNYVSVILTEPVVLLNEFFFFLSMLANNVQYH